MAWFEATIIFILGIITFTVILPVGIELMPDMQNTMGTGVTTMISAMFVIILISAFIIYMRQSQQPDQYMGTGEGNF